MRLQHPPPALYAAFDLFPSAKGAATHIDRFARRLFERAGGGVLQVLGDGVMPPYQREGAVEILRFDAPIANFLQRAMAYGRQLDRLIEAHGGSLRLCHFRDPWGGVPILRHAGFGYRTLYEVNGLPSVELLHAYPDIAPATRDKLRAAEDYCLQQADRIVTPAQGIADLLATRGVAWERISVIPNGADPDTGDCAAPAPWPYLIYFGAVQPWQGLDTLLQAFSRLQDFPELRLVICSSVHRRRTKPYRKLAQRLGLAGRVHWEHALPREALAPWRRHALLSVAPLSECARNLEQGCSPLKVLESMAAGVPVVASDVPSVREIMNDGEHGRLVPPDRPADLARAIRILLQYPDLRQRMGEQARRHLLRHYTWERALAQLDLVYQDLGLTPSKKGD